MDKQATKKFRVVLTRENNSAVAEILRSKGGIEVVEMPLIKIERNVEDADFADIMEEMGTYDWITFSSANGVRHFFEQFLKSAQDIRAIGIARLACVGEATARELANFYLRADVVPDESNAIEMIRKMGDYETLDNLKILCVHGNLAARDYIEILEKEHHALVDSVEVYKTSRVELDKDSPEAKEFRKKGADAVVFASPSAVDSFAKNAVNLLLGDKAVRPKIVAIGSTTAEAVKKYGMAVAAQAGSPYPESVAEAVLSVLK